MILFDKIFFLGIGGIGMSALARYFLAHGKHVAGYDRVESSLTMELVAEGCEIIYRDAPDEIASSFLQIDRVLVVYTPAISIDNLIFNYFKDKGFSVKKRAEVLGILTHSAKSLCVAGTHGKSTTSSLLAHILTGSDSKCNAFLGAIATNFNSNLVLNEEAKFMVVEADEFDRSFLQLAPFCAIITSCDPDHLDIYGSNESFIEGFSQFASKIHPDGLMVIKEGIELLSPAKKITYALFSKTADYAIDRLYFEHDVGYCDIRVKSDYWMKVELGLSGIHNAENALACIALLMELGLSPSFIKQGIQSFLGLKRRFEIIFKSEDVVYLDDYAHHPTEIDALIASLKMRYPNKKITGVFQPHLYSRTKDFAVDFARSLSALNEVILLPIYPAREMPILGVTSDYLLELITNDTKKLISKEELVGCAESFNSGVFVTIGAGDIDRFVQPIKEVFMHKLVKR